MGGEIHAVGGYTETGGREIGYRFSTHLFQAATKRYMAALMSSTTTAIDMSVSINIAFDIFRLQRYK